MLTEIPQLKCPVLPEGAVVQRANVLSALDRPDRLELEFCVRSDEADLAVWGGGLLHPGRPLALNLGASRLFSGRVDRSGLRMDHHGDRLIAVAYAEYDGRRHVKTSDCYYELTDAEIARSIAVELGLRPRVEDTVEVNRRVERRGDPLRFLRGRARRIGFELAITRGELYFSSEIPRLEPATLRLGRDSRLLAFAVEDRGPAGRGGRFEVAGDPAWQPLVDFDLGDLGPAWETRYRVIRSCHYIGSSAYRSVVEFLERGVDFTSWQRGGAEEFFEE